MTQPLEADYKSEELYNIDYTKYVITNIAEKYGLSEDATLINTLTIVNTLYAVYNGKQSLEKVIPELQNSKLDENSFSFMVPSRGEHPTESDLFLPILTEMYKNRESDESFSYDFRQITENLPPGVIAIYLENDPQKIKGITVFSPMSVNDMMQQNSKIRRNAVKSAQIHANQTYDFIKRTFPSITTHGLGATWPKLLHYGKHLVNYHMAPHTPETIVSGHNTTVLAMERTVNVILETDEIYVDKPFNISIVGGLGSIGLKFAEYMLSKYKHINITLHDLNEKSDQFETLNKQYDNRMTFTKNLQEALDAAPIIVSAITTPIPDDIIIKKGTIFIDDSEPRAVTSTGLQNLTIQNGIYIKPILTSRQKLQRLAIDYLNHKLVQYEFGDEVGLTNGAFYSCEVEATLASEVNANTKIGKIMQQIRTIEINNTQSQGKVTLQKMNLLMQILERSFYTDINTIQGAGKLVKNEVLKTVNMRKQRYQK